MSISKVGFTTRNGLNGDGTSVEKTKEQGKDKTLQHNDDEISI